MPTIIRTLTPDRVEPVGYIADSLKEAEQYEPDDGIYTVTNTYQRTKTLKLDAHFDRMADSAARAGIPLSLDRARLRAALREMIEHSDFGDVRFRITVARSAPQHFILTVEPFTPPAPELIERGVFCITAPDSARHNAEAKTTDWMHQRKALADAMPTGIYDTFLRDENDYLLEGLASNFYAILNGELRTAEGGVLKGISRQIVLDVAPILLRVREEAVQLNEIQQISEAFLTSSSRGIIPVVEIDGMKIGQGIPGPQTRALRNAYDLWVEDHLEEL